MIETNRSGTITTGGTSQLLCNANEFRVSMSVQNLSSGDIWINRGATSSAANPAIKIPSGALYEFPKMQNGYVYGGVLSIYGATTGQEFTAWEG